MSGSVQESVGKRNAGGFAESIRASFFDTSVGIEMLAGADGITGDMVEFGRVCGTLTVPAVLRALSNVTALDINLRMLNCVR